MKKKNEINKRPPKSTTPLKKSKYHSSKYLSLLETDSLKKYIEFGLRVKNQELKWVSYQVENQVGVHYYLILKKKK